MLGAALASCGGLPEPAGTFKQKAVVLGFDGMDPRLVERYMADGKLPNFSRLARAGGSHRLETSTSPESPTAWASFAIGGNAGKHNIFDFLVRDTATYLPDLGMVKQQPARFVLGYFPVARPKVTSLRGGTSFWVTAGEAGVRTRLITVPVTFPPEPVPNGRLLSGLPLPDIRGTVGTFYYFATDLSRYEEGNTEMGGILKRLVFEGDVARSAITGPTNPIAQAETRRARQQGGAAGGTPQADGPESIDIPFAVRWDRAARRASVEIQRQTLHLAEGEWSGWVPLEFRVNLIVRIRGMAQFFLRRAEGDLQLYVSPVNWVPDAPPVPISSPDGYAARLQDRLGVYRTLGWAEATWPLNEDRIDETTFLDDLFRAFDDRARIILHEIDQRQWDLVVGVIESTDRVQHMMWRLIDDTHPMYDREAAARYGDAIERVFRRADDLVGEVLTRVDPGTMVIVLSDHGFHSFKYAVNLNTWLVQEGFMVLKGQASSDKNLDQLFLGGQFWEHVDWSRTRAYSMGLGQIYFNLRGREGQGIVGEGDEYRRLGDEIASRLLAMTDPAGGARIVSSVYKRDDVYEGPFIGNAPDLQVGLEDGYRVSWQTSLGGAPAGLVYANLRKWSGDHCSFDYRTIPGTLVLNRTVTSEAIRLIDVAPTVLKHFGLAVPKEMDGRPLF